jgi:hypothetical protein
VTENDIVGYTVAYEQEEIQFPVYAVAVIAAVFLAAGVINASPWLLMLAVLPVSAVYYNFPLIETGRPRLGAGQYGLFVEGLGLVQWRAIDQIEMVPTDMRGITSHELHVSLKMPIGDALILDWRDRPLLRKAMRMPWSMKSPMIIRIALDVLDRPNTEIHETFLRMWRFYRGQ